MTIREYRTFRVRRHRGASTPCMNNAPPAPGDPSSMLFATTRALGRAM
jgi:hypothetical protein